MELVLLSPGTEVIILGNITAVIRSVMIAGERLAVEYKVAFVNGGTLEERWIDDFMVQRRDPKEMRIGFRT